MQHICIQPKTGNITVVFEMPAEIKTPANLLVASA